MKRLLIVLSLLLTSVLARSADNAFTPAAIEALECAVETSIRLGEIPGAVVWVEKAGQHYVKAFGQRQLVPAKEPMTVDTIFDLASLTKVVATTPAILRLMEQGKLDLAAPVRKYIPEFNHPEVTVHHLITHNSGLPPGIAALADKTYAAGIASACQQTLKQPPGTKFVYSDVNFILLGEIVFRISGQRLDKFVTQEVWEPLGMQQTRFVPPAKLRGRIAPTTLLEEGVLRGVVHDPTSRAMGGVTGHAGGFSTISDVAKYARMMLKLGVGESGQRVLSEATVRQATSRQSPTTFPEQRGLGWDIDTGYSSLRGDFFPVGKSYGHTGWTGTSLWIDTTSQSFVIILANRNHPNESGKTHDLRISVANQACLAMGLTLPPPSVPVLNGIDVLEAASFAALKGLKIGLITNQTGRNRTGKTTIDLLANAPEVKLAALFSPEHGIRGQLDQAKINDEVDATTGVPIYSLYGDNRKPTANQLAGLDALVFDIQDIGTRFYTYISTMKNAMEIANAQGLRFIVLDRLNPINGEAVAGPLAQPPFIFTSCHALPVRHGMTVGELAGMFKAEEKWTLPLEVIQLQNWKRNQWMDQTGLAWMNPSPNMRSLTAAAVYPGLGLVEMTNVSVGRGTDQPFGLVGAPWIDAVKLQRALRAEKLPGVDFLPVQFTPTSSVHAKKLCHGVRFVVFDRTHFQPLSLGVAVATALKAQGEAKFEWQKISKLLAHPGVLNAIGQGKSRRDIEALWKSDLSSFVDRRKAFLLYP
jgi:uncharacterized protein YbbC (DUF1343 family)/CubicO group peptidase (beta-lactamase class C family)